MSKDIYILGVSMSNHDRAAALSKNGRVVGAISEERLDRRKKSEGFYHNSPKDIVLPPLASITYVLEKESITLADVDLIVCGRSINLCKETLLKYLPVDRSKVIEPPIPSHHLAHAYSAFGTSPFKESAVLVIDEQGHHLEDGSYEKISMYEGSNSKLKLIQSIKGTNSNISLGMFYDAFAALVGLSEAGMPAAGKLMGLAPYGKKREEWGELIELIEDSVNIDLYRLDKFFSHLLPLQNEKIVINHLEDLLKKYKPVNWNSQLGFDLAYKAQEELERAILYISGELFKKTNYKTLSYAGGVALNCTTNQKILEGGWEDIYVHPASTDDGVAVGLTMYGWLEYYNKEREDYADFNPFLGKKYDENTIEEAFEEYGLNPFSKVINSSELGAELLSEGKIICWFQGGSEWGPRALGARSIIADPTQQNITDKINSKIKFREAFRPFGISVLEEELSHYVMDALVPKSLSPYMLSVAQVKEKSLESVRHVDHSIRYQTVSKSLQPTYYNLIHHFGKKSGTFAVLNTSFNLLGEPLVETPEDAVRQFLLSGADALIINNYVIELNHIPKSTLERSKKKAFEKSNINPLKVALSLEAADFSTEAINYLNEYPINLDKADSTTLIRYESLLLRYAINNNDHESALLHIEKLMEYMNYPSESHSIINILKEGNYQKYSEVVDLLSNVANMKNAAIFFSNLLKLDNPKGISEVVTIGNE
ncbi:carbamoyltransferase C-terminal domain-containing protein [Alkalihalophilus marmarensis]|uniref:Carbamoyltransferase n=1 Tax=Alkalihalophilus marmarensis DSM 21297 TaxID=1188261 RepID=U6SMC6_9BACI|nr:carbamoyltransferase C-terminal domain-containing protein [Alkalihalophilus marmarensis]ERN52070.1 hypothetical protein A33I_18430 [Alkalihalophilus marmarensis DSM 21297]